MIKFYILLIAVMTWCKVLATVWITVAMALEQEVTVTGKLLCEGRPMSEATVKLIEEEPLVSIVGRAETRSGPDGVFEINVVYDSPYKIVPVMTIDHECGGDRKVKERMVLFDLWTTESSTARNRVFDFGPFPLMKNVYHWECNPDKECLGDQVHVNGENEDAETE